MIMNDMINEQRDSNITTKEIILPNDLILLKNAMDKIPSTWFSLSFDPKERKWKANLMTMSKGHFMQEGISIDELLKFIEDHKSSFSNEQYEQMCQVIEEYIKSKDRAQVGGIDLNLTSQELIAHIENDFDTQLFQRGDLPSNLNYINGLELQILHLEQMVIV